MYEASPEGYFGLVDLGGHYTGPPSTRDEPSASWLASALASHGIVLSFDPRAPDSPPVARWQALPPPDPASLTPRGHIVSEAKAGETYRARVRLDRPSHVFVKLTWSPDLAATVDGGSATLLHVTPGFAAVPVPAGEHEVVVNYEPGILKPLLCLLGIGLFGLGAYALRLPRAAQVEAGLSACLASLGERWATPRTATAAVLVHPLFRGRLISGHGALEYPPRLVEMAKVLSDGYVPPIWAPRPGGRTRAAPLRVRAPARLPRGPSRSARRDSPSPMRSSSAWRFCTDWGPSPSIASGAPGSPPGGPRSSGRASRRSSTRPTLAGRCSCRGSSSPCSRCSPSSGCGRGGRRRWPACSS